MKFINNILLSMISLRNVMQNKNIVTVRHNSTNSGSNINNALPPKKTIINPESFLETRKIEGPVLESKLPENVSPWFLSGFIDAEGNFDILLINNVKALAKTGVKFRFRLSSNYKDVVLLAAIGNYFNGGTLSLIRKDTGVITLEISSIGVIKDVIIPFLDAYPLKGTKYYDYRTWRSSFFDFLENKDTLETKLQMIDRLKEAKGNLNNNKKEFLVPIEHLNSIDPNYIAGFCNGDGTTSLITSPDSFVEGFGRPTLSFSQHANNLPLLEAIKDKLTVGRIEKQRDAFSLVVTKSKDINEIIIPYFKKHPFYGTHAIAFFKWSNLTTYLQTIKEDKSVFNKENKPQIISSIRDIWKDRSTLVYTDLTLEVKELLIKFRNLPGQR